MPGQRLWNPVLFRPGDLQATLCACPRGPMKTVLARLRDQAGVKPLADIGRRVSEVSPCSQMVEGS
ncbi:hypothetical protein PtB15_3B57 [Puccinia triticina]|nr:hypothetical protein PtB15_3B57 [Puccinia triticina]